MARAGRWALGRHSFPRSGRAKAPCWAGCELQAELSFQRRPHSLARGPSLHLQSQKQRPSLSREPPAWFLQPEKLHVIRLSPPRVVSPSPGPAVGRSIHRGRGLGHGHLWGEGRVIIPPATSPEPKPKTKPTKAHPRHCEQIRWLSSHKHFTPQNYSNSHTLHPEITNLK